jgi:peptidoglycan/xylan/chitin deacetylase (PgdA/CDA1 family)
MDRRDFFKVASGSLASLALLPLIPVLSETESAYAESSINPVNLLPKSDSPRMAWTVDDGCSYESVHRYTELAIEKDLRFTFFVYSAMSPWKLNAKLLKPLVASGQIQIGNHSHTHPNLTQLSYSEIQKELMDCHNFIEKTYEVDARPYYRTPYGAINRTVIQAAADVGYTLPVSWSGSLVDSGVTNSKRIIYHAEMAMRDRAIMLGHANNLVASENFDSLLAIVTDRNLSLVTLKDAFTAK